MDEESCDKSGLPAASPAPWSSSLPPVPQPTAGVTDPQHSPNSDDVIPPLLSLPPELIDAILSFASPVDLARVSQACRTLHSHATADVQWLPRVQDNVPGLTLTSPSPYSNYRDLYAAHDPRWFLPKYKIWFCDRHLMGKMIVVRYDPRRGCIEGYQLLAVSDGTASQVWSGDSQVVIHDFEPRVKLHLDKPVLQFHGADRDPGTIPALQLHLQLQPGVESRFAAETPMALDNRADYIFSNFSLARPLPHAEAEAALDLGFPYDGAWPPLPIPAPHRVAGYASTDDDPDLSLADLPACRAEASDHTFRIRQWMEMAGTPTAPGAVLGQGVAGMMQVLTGWVPANTVGTGAPPPLHGMAGPRIGEEVITYSTLDPALYTPTHHKPWRGIWVGDYSGHGCEFLLINQPDGEDDPTDEEPGLARRGSESDEAWAERTNDARIYRGRLEAIKLTGDPNVPRGEYTFIAEDLGDEGFVGISQEPPFVGARIVKSKGHIAGTGFQEDKFVDSQLMLLSENRLAQYWVGFGHINYFERVDIDKLLVP